MISFAIVIPCLNEEAYIGRCLQSILDQDREGISLEVYVVDGMSTDGTRDIIATYVKNHNGIHLIDNLRRTTPVALNMGIQTSTAQVVAILGAHTVLKPSWLRSNVKVLNAHPEAGCVGGIIENVHENEVARIISLAMQSPFGVGNARFRTGGKAGYVDTVAFGAYRREVFEKIGLFDVRLVRNQDDEFNYRLTAAGYKVWFDPSIVASYYVRGSYNKLRRQYWQYGYWKVLVNRMHGTVTTWRQLVPLAFCLYLVFGLMIAAIFPLLIGFYTFGICFYLVGALWAALRLRIYDSDVPKLVFVFIILHLGYGFGYAKGVLDFLLLRKQPDSFNPKLTR